MTSVERLGRAPDGWDAFVRENDGAGFVHLSAWGDLLSDVLGLEPVYLVARGDERRLDGVLPLIRMPDLFVRSALVSMPYLNYGGPVGDPAARRALAAAAVEEAKAAGDVLLELRTRRGGGDAGALSHGRSKVTVVLDLTDDPRTLFEDRFRSKLRSQIRRPMKEGFRTAFGAEQVEPFYEVFAENMRDLGTPVLPLAFFQGLRERFSGEVEFGVVFDGDTPVAGGCGFHWRDEFEITWASSLRSRSRQAPNMLLYWAFMERSIEAGRRRFNFGRCTPGSGTHRFKLQWGGEDEPLPWMQWPAAAAPPDAGSGLFSLATAVWRRLPRGVADRLGPRVARRLPTF